MKQWIDNPVNDRIGILAAVENELREKGKKISMAAIEKDWWVTVVIRALFKTSCAGKLMFKGGTSLSKGYGIIDRFSEDIDLSLSHTFFGIEGTNKSRREKLRKTGRKYIHDVLSRELDEELRQMGITGFMIENVTHARTKSGELVPMDSDKDPTVIMVNYPTMLDTLIDYIPPRVKIEVSVLSMDEPVEQRTFGTFIGEWDNTEDEISVTVPTVLPTRTFLEKTFLLSEEFQKDFPRSLRMSRHLYDIYRMSVRKKTDKQPTYADLALSDRQLYEHIVEHRRTYYGLKYVDYDRHRPDTICFLPPDKHLPEWEKDYQEMQRHFIFTGSPSFEDLMDALGKLQDSFHNKVW